MPASIVVQCDRNITIEEAMLLSLFSGQPPGFFRFESLDDRISILIEEGNHLIQWMILPGVACFGADCLLRHGWDGCGVQRGNPIPKLTQERRGLIVT